MKTFKIAILSTAILATLVGTAAARWECHQEMMVTQEVTAQSQQEDTGSSMYTSDGYLKSSKRGANSRQIRIGNSNYSNNGNSNYRSSAVIHYFTVCEDNGRVVSIIEHTKALNGNRR